MISGILTAKVKIRRLSVKLKGSAEISDTNYNNSKTEDQEDEC